MARIILLTLAWGAIGVVFSAFADQGQTAADVSQSGALDSTHYEAAFRAFVNEVDSTYPFFDLKGVRDDWDNCKESLLEKVKQCRSNDAFYGLLYEAGRRLRDPHMGLRDIRGKIPLPEPRFYPGVSFLPAVNEQVVIMWASPEYADILQPGTLVTQIDGRNAREFLEQDAENLWDAGGAFSSRQRARLYAYRIPLQGNRNDKHQLTVLKGQQSQTVDIENKWEARGWPHTYAMPGGLVRRGDCLYGKLDSAFGYIYLRRIRDVTACLDAAFRSFEGIKGLIIDLRGNGGGGYDAEVFKRFDKKQGPLPGIPFYRGDMVVLIDAGTFSAGETFARDLVHAADAHLMGSRTAGSSTAKRTWKLPHGLGTVILPRRSRWGFDGQPIEYNGIAPHEVLEVVPSELQKGQNSGIRRAEEYLERKREDRKTGSAEPLVIIREVVVDERVEAQ
jgi:C-terminal processing protease CtpA/Prc